MLQINGIIKGKQMIKETHVAYLKFQIIVKPIKTHSTIIFTIFYTTNSIQSGELHV